MSAPISVFVIDPPERLDPPTDTSLAIMRESFRRGHRVFYCTLVGLRLENDRPMARVRPVAFTEGQELFDEGAPEELELAACQVLYMRKDPPVGTSYLHATYILDRLPERVLQINPARTLSRFCEKLIPSLFPGLLPESITTRSIIEIDAFLDRIGKIVLKPLEECSGRGIFLLTRDDPDRQSLIERVTQNEERFIQAQRFLPEIVEGDKRVILLGGEILGWLRRVPAAGDFRSNVNAGGHCVPCDLTDEDRAICSQVGRWLAKEEIHLAGVDIVGRHVLEVNITSPSCLREMNALTGERLERKIVDYVEQRIRW